MADKTAFKWFCFVTLIVQSSAHVLILRHSRTLPGPQYLPSTAILLAELLKLTLCTSMHYLTSNEPLLPLLLGQESDWLKMTVPSAVFHVQNYLSYMSLTFLDAGTFQITNQMKILTTAFFSITLLNARLSPQHWLAICCLTLGVVVVHIDKLGSAKSESSARIYGLMSVAASTTCSGFGGVW